MGKQYDMPQEEPLDREEFYRGLSEAEKRLKDMEKSRGKPRLDIQSDGEPKEKAVPITITSEEATKK